MEIQLFNITRHLRY